jgi:hypothetical protein
MASSPSSVDLSESRQANLYASSTIPCGLAVIAVALRFWCRRRASGVRFWLDDWLVLVACVSVLLVLFVSVYFREPDQLFLTSLLGIRCCLVSCYAVVYESPRRCCGNGC